MFANSPFNDFGQPFTLKFKDRKLESYYRKITDRGYLSRFSAFYLILISVSAIMILGIFMACTFSAAGYTDEAIGTAIAVGVLFFGLVMELLVNCCGKLRVIRTVPLGITIFLACALGDYFLEPRPTIRPGAIGLLLLAIVNCMLYSYSWIIGSAVLITGFLIWLAFLIGAYANSASTIPLAVTLANFCLGIWVVPFILYFSEKKARENALLQWCRNKVLFECTKIRS